MSQPVNTTSFKSASGTKSLISGELPSVRLPSRIVPICVSEPIGLASPRRTASTPAIIVVATAPRPTTITPSLPVAGATLPAAAVLWPPDSSVDIASSNPSFASDICLLWFKILIQPTPQFTLSKPLLLRCQPSLGSGFASAIQMRPQEPDEGQSEHNFHRQMEAMEPLVEARIRVPRLSQPPPRIG